MQLWLSAPSAPGHRISRCNGNSGNALADILYGKVNPPGKLSVSYPNTVLNESYCYNRSTEDDTTIAWPFGYGMSYTKFEYSNINITPETATTEPTFRVTFEVKNTGTVEGDEVAQLYLSPTSQEQNIRPIQLQGFKRVTLKPGETKTVTLDIATEQLGYYADKQWNIAPGTFTIKVGASSRDIRLAKDITLTGNKVTKPLRDTYFAK